MTGQPSREYRQHVEAIDAPQVDERAFRQGWRVRTRLDQLLADWRITREEWEAAVAYRAAWAKARELVGIEPGMLRVAGAASPDAAMIARLDAVTRLRMVEAAIGVPAARLLLASVVHDIAWAELGRFWGCHPNTIREATVRAIKALSPAWGEATRQGAAFALSVSPPKRRRPVARPEGRQRA